MKSFLFVLGFVVFSFLSPVVSYATEGDYADKVYLEKVESIISDKNVDAVDWPALRRMYQDTSFYYPYGAQQIWSDLSDAEDRYKESGSDADKKAYQNLLKQHFAHYRSHIHADSQERRLKGKAFTDDAFHYAAFKKIINSILKSGDGKSFETAFTVIDVAEERLLIRSYFKLKAGGQRLVNHNGRMYDVIELYDENKESRGNMYFDITVLMSKPI